jgi:hypothetical protein
MSKGNTPENSVKREFLRDITAEGGLAVVAKSYRDIDTALREAGYNGPSVMLLFEAPDHPGHKYYEEEKT